VLLGGLFGLFLKYMLNNRSNDNRLIIALATLFVFCGICALLDISPLLGCMAMGTVYINVTNDDKLFKQMNYFAPPILLLFFVRSGVNFNLSALVNTSTFAGTVPLIVIGIVYFIVRIIGKYFGAYTGAAIAGKSKEVKNYLGLGLIPQAGVAIGLAALGARVLGGEQGQALETIILASSVLYELIGPACAKLSLYLSRSYERVPKHQRVNEVVGSAPITNVLGEIKQNELAFTEAAIDYHENTGKNLSTESLNEDKEVVSNLEIKEAEAKV